MPFYSCVIYWRPENSLVMRWWAVSLSFSVISARHMINDKPLAFGMFSFFFKERVWECISFTHAFADKAIVQSLRRFFSSHFKSGWCIPCYFQRVKQQICKRVSVLMRFENLIWWLKHRFCTAPLGRRHLWKALRGRVCKVGRYEGKARWSNTKKVQ